MGKTRFLLFLFAVLLSVSLVSSWVGVEYVVGQPEVFCPTNQELYSDENINLNFEVKNVDDSNGVFGLKLECAGSSKSLNPNRISLNSGETKVISQTLRWIVSETTTGRCTFKAYAIKDLDVEDSCSFDYIIRPRKQEINPESIISENDNSISSPVIVAIAIITGFIILAITLRRRNKK